MAYNASLKDRIRLAFQLFPDSIHRNIQEKKMFGGIAFLYKGKMTVGIVKDDLMVRVKPEHMEATLKMPDVKPMDFTGRPMKEFVFVCPHGYATEEELQHWLEMGVAHALYKLNEK